MEGPINELVGDDEVSRLMFFLERSHGRDREDPLHAQLLHCKDIRAEVKLRWQQQVPPPVAREKGYPPSGQIAQHKGVRRIAEWGGDASFSNVSQAGHGIEPAAPDDADFRFLQTTLR